MGGRGGGESALGAIAPSTRKKEVSSPSNHLPLKLNGPSRFNPNGEKDRGGKKRHKGRTIKWLFIRRKRGQP